MPDLPSGSSDDVATDVKNKSKASLHLVNTHQYSARILVKGSHVQRRCFDHLFLSRSLMLLDP